MRFLPFLLLAVGVAGCVTDDTSDDPGALAGGDRPAVRDGIAPIIDIRTDCAPGVKPCALTFTS